MPTVHKLTKKITSLPKMYEVYLKLLSAVSDTFHLTNMERLIFSYILTDGEYTPETRKRLLEKENLNPQVISNATTKFRTYQLLVENKPNTELINIKKEPTFFVINLKYEETK